MHDRHNGRISATRDFTTIWDSAYFQADYIYNDYVKFVGGFQLNKPENLDHDISPRLGAIFTFDKNWGAKLLYGKVFRASYGGETGLDIPGFIVGNKELESEKINTFDAQISYNTEKSFAALTFYHSMMNDVVGLGRADDGRITYVNGGSNEYSGIEFEGKTIISNELEMVGSMSYQIGEELHNNNKNLGMIPRFMAKLGGSYKNDEGYSLSLFNSYYGDVVDNGVRNGANPESDSHNILTANAIFDLNNIFALKDLPSTIFTLYGKNLLDEKVYFPDVTNAVNTIPHISGRAFYGAITIKF